MKKEEFYRTTSAYKIDPEMNENSINSVKAVISLMDKSKGKVLDIGCGTGVQAKYISENTGATICGVDIGPFNVKAARKRGIEAKVGDVEKKFPYTSNYFDGAISFMLIEHLFNHHTFLQEIKRVLKKDGYLILVTPNIAYWPNRLLLLFGKTVIDSQPHKAMEENQHIRFFTPETLAKLVEKHGFKVERKFTRYPQIPFLVRLSRKLGNPYINAGNFGFMIYLKARKA